MTTEQLNDLAAIRRALYGGQKSLAKLVAQQAFERLSERVTNFDLLNTWIMQHGVGKPGGLMYRVWDTGTGHVVVDLLNDWKPESCAVFQAGNVALAFRAAANYVTKAES